MCVNSATVNTTSVKNQATDLLKDSPQMNQLLPEAHDILLHGISQRFVKHEIFRRRVEHL